MRSYGKLTLGLTLLVLTFFISTMGFAYEIVGLSTPRDWQGNGVRVQRYDSDWSNQAVVAIDLKYQKNDTTATSYSEKEDDYGISGWGNSQYKQLKGDVAAYGYPENLWQAGGYYRDQIYFTTANGQPAALAISFNVSASARTYSADNAMALLSIGWGLYPGTGDYFPFGNIKPIDLKGPRQLVEYAGTVTMNTRDNGSPVEYLIQSGTYVPFSVAVWGTVVDAELNWGDTVGFFNFSALDLNGTQLGPDEFKIYENVQPGSPVPIPAAAWLLGTGLIGLVALKRRLRH